MIEVERAEVGHETTIELFSDIAKELKIEKLQLYISFIYYLQLYVSKLYILSPCYYSLLLNFFLVYLVNFW